MFNFYNYFVIIDLIFDSLWLTKSIHLRRRLSRLWNCSRCIFRVLITRWDLFRSISFDVLINKCLGKHDFVIVGLKVLCLLSIITSSKLPYEWYRNMMLEMVTKLNISDVFIMNSRMKYVSIVQYMYFYC